MVKFTPRTDLPTVKDPPLSIELEAGRLRIRPGGFRIQKGSCLYLEWRHCSSVVQLVTYVRSIYDSKRSFIITSILYTLNPLRCWVFFVCLVLIRFFRLFSDRYVLTQTKTKASLSYLEFLYTPRCQKCGTRLWQFATLCCKRFHPDFLYNYAA